MGYIWTPQMAENLRWLMQHRRVEPIWLASRLGYSTVPPVQRMMRLEGSAYRPRNTGRIGELLGLPFAERHHWAMPSDQFRAWVGDVDAEREQRVLARALGKPRRGIGRLARWVRAALGFGTTRGARP
ncbi:MAG TPA: hypothetical protein VNA25_12750 [Phycisphaerae bacterium]|nr:hypothetical protein [Phycisphaerae bacterium]